MSPNLFKYFTKRLLGLIPVLFIIITISFFLMRLAPGGPFDQERVLNSEIEKNIRDLYRLNEPVWKQYFFYLWGVLHGDLGFSFTYQDRPVGELIIKSFGTSFVLGITALAFALICGVAVGILSAVKKGKPLDYLFLSFTIFGVSVPSIVLGPLLVVIFGVWFGVLPVAGWGSLRELVLPAFTLSVIYISFIARITRGSVLEILGRDYVKTARGLGMKERQIILKYVLKGSLLPVISYLGPAFAGIVTGSLVIERIFLIPGLGQHFIQAALNRDYPLALGTVIFYSVILLIVNLICDLLYVYIDPRITYE